MAGAGAKTAVVAVIVLAVANSGAHHHGHHHHGHHGGTPASLTAVPAGSGSTGANVTLGQQMAAQQGWTGSQWNCLDWLWTRESGWQMVWNTAGSGAYGIPQSLPADKMASAGADYMTNPATQIKWGLGYVAGRYGDPCNAWSHEEQFSWY